jgi:hypothetical protein
VTIAVALVLVYLFALRDVTRLEYRPRDPKR